jgi:hypothetical protein
MTEQDDIARVKRAAEEVQRSMLEQRSTLASIDAQLISLHETASQHTMLLEQLRNKLAQLSRGLGVHCDGSSQVPGC